MSLLRFDVKFKSPGIFANKYETKYIFMVFLNSFEKIVFIDENVLIFFSI